MHLRVKVVSISVAIRQECSKAAKKQAASTIKWSVGDKKRAAATGRISNGEVCSAPWPPGLHKLVTL